jgi:ribosomal protein L40E
MSRTGPRLERCRKCAATSGLVTLDGSKCDGMPGVNYRVCNNCGHAKPITARRRREKLDVPKEAK